MAVVKGKEQVGFRCACGEEDHVEFTGFNEYGGIVLAEEHCRRVMETFFGSRRLDLGYVPEDKKSAILTVLKTHEVTIILPAKSSEKERLNLTNVPIAIYLRV